ncbi:MAG: metallophosphoesterase, partial [Candidatus Aenigmatarchaeota archaeon]
EKIEKAIEILNSNNINFLIHCGDFIAPFSIIPFEKLNCDWVGVFGNNDGEKLGLKKASQERIKDPPYFLEIYSKRIAITHIISDLEADIICFGHTHSVEIKKENSKLFINPGEVGGWLSKKSSLVILDLEKLEPKVIYF